MIAWVRVARTFTWLIQVSIWMLTTERVPRTICPGYSWISRLIIKRDSKVLMSVTKINWTSQKIMRALLQKRCSMWISANYKSTFQKRSKSIIKRESETTLVLFCVTSTKWQCMSPLKTSTCAQACANRVFSTSRAPCTKVLPKRNACTNSRTQCTKVRTPWVWMRS